MPSQDEASVLSERGRAELMAGRPALALGFFDDALRLEPALLPALRGRSFALQALDRPAEVVEACERALLHLPDDTTLHYNRGIGLRMLGRLPEAEASLRRAIALNPAESGGHGALGVVLEAQGRLEEARQEFTAALQRNPGDADTLNNLGNLLKRLGDRAGAIESFNRAIARRPDFVEALNNRGAAEAAGGDLDAALGSYRLALSSRPDFVPALVNLGAALADNGQPRAAIAPYDRAIALEADNATARWNRALARLLTGDFAGGWQDYAWRWQTSDFRARRRHLPQPLWRGEDLAGQRILLWSEQGIGDEIMFLGLAGELLAAGAQVALECDARLVPLAARAMPRIETVARRDVADRRTASADFAFQAPTGDLLRWLRPNAAAIRPLGGYLRADPARTAAQRARHGLSGQRVAGLSWHSANRLAGARRSIPVRQLAPLLDVPGWRFVDLQYGNRQQDRAELARTSSHGLIHDPAIDAMADLDGWAAEIAAVDVVVSIDNSAVHLAAALGKPVLLLLPTAPDWRWGEAGERSSWYATVRLLRQERAGVWEEPIARAAQLLAAWPR